MVKLTATHAPSQMLDRAHPNPTRCGRPAVAEFRDIDSRTRRPFAPETSPSRLVPALRLRSAPTSAEAWGPAHARVSHARGSNMQAMLRRAFLASAITVSVLLFGSVFSQALADDSDQVLSIDHYVSHLSKVPAIAGEPVQLYVRERAQAGSVLRSPSLGDRVVLFVHGAGTPAEVAFDVPARDYSWMGYLARAGFDVFSMDATGYGRSTRPPAMNDPCNLTREQQAAFIPSLVTAPCAPSYPRQMTTIASDWDDIGAAVDYVRALRHVDRVSLISWSLGGPRAGGYAAQHPDKVQKLVLLAPAYNRMTAATPPATLPAEGATMNTQSRDEFIANWDRQVGCPAQYEAPRGAAAYDARPR